MMFAVEWRVLQHLFDVLASHEVTASITGKMGANEPRCSFDADVPTTIAGNNLSDYRSDTVFRKNVMDGEMLAGFMALPRPAQLEVLSRWVILQPLHG